jgi:hypothetical protein
MVISITLMIFLNNRVKLFKSKTEFSQGTIFKKVHVHEKADSGSIQF